MRSHENEPVVIYREVQAVVAFLEAKIKGRGPATLEECVYFWGTETKECDTFKN